MFFGVLIRWSTEKPVSPAGLNRGQKSSSNSVAPTGYPGGNHFHIFSDLGLQTLIENSNPKKIIWPELRFSQGWKLKLSMACTAVQREIIIHRNLTCDLTKVRKMLSYRKHCGCQRIAKYFAQILDRSWSCRRLVNFSSFGRYISSASASVNNEEIDKFNRMASEWWNPDGDFKALHSMNTLRIELIRNGFLQTGVIDVKSLETEFPLKGLRILDIGCGGGILSQPLGRIGAEVIGLDPAKESINIANLQLPAELKKRVQFVNSSLEDFVSGNPNLTFDAVVASEVIEHVRDTRQFLEVAAQLVKPNGSIFLTTINRTALSWLGAIVAAEYLLQLIPRGTHDWQSFISPEDLQSQLHACGCNTRLVHGMNYNVWSNSWNWTRCTDINYAIHAVKDSAL